MFLLALQKPYAYLTYLRYTNSIIIIIIIIIIITVHYILAYAFIM